MPPDKSPFDYSNLIPPPGIQRSLKFSRLVSDAIRPSSSRYNNILIGSAGRSSAKLAKAIARRSTIGTPMRASKWAEEISIRHGVFNGNSELDLDWVLPSLYYLRIGSKNNLESPTEDFNLVPQLRRWTTYNVVLPKVAIPVPQSVAIDRPLVTRIAPSMLAVVNSFITPLIPKVSSAVTYTTRVANSLWQFSTKLIENIIVHNVLSSAISESAQPNLNLLLSHPAVPIVSWTGIAVPKPDRTEFIHEPRQQIQWNTHQTVLVNSRSLQEHALSAITDGETATPNFPFMHLPREMRFIDSLIVGITNTTRAVIDRLPASVMMLNGPSDVMRNINSVNDTDYLRVASQQSIRERSYIHVLRRSINKTASEVLNRLPAATAMVSRVAASGNFAAGAPELLTKTAKTTVKQTQDRPMPPTLSSLVAALTVAGVLGAIQPVHAAASLFNTQISPYNAPYTDYKLPILHKRLILQESHGILISQRPSSRILSLVYDPVAIPVTNSRPKQTPGSDARSSFSTVQRSPQKTSGAFFQSEVSSLATQILWKSVAQQRHQVPSVTSSGSIPLKRSAERKVGRLPTTFVDRIQWLIQSYFPSPQESPRYTSIGSSFPKRQTNQQRQSSIPSFINEPSGFSKSFANISEIRSSQTKSDLYKIFWRHFDLPSIPDDDRGPSRFTPATPVPAQITRSTLGPEFSRASILKPLMSNTMRGRAPEGQVNTQWFSTIAPPAGQTALNSPSVGLYFRPSVLVRSGFASPLRITIPDVQINVIQNTSSRVSSPVNGTEVQFVGGRPWRSSGTGSVAIIEREVQSYRSLENAIFRPSTFDYKTSDLPASLDFSLVTSIREFILDTITRIFGNQIFESELATSTSPTEVLQEEVDAIRELSKSHAIVDRSIISFITDHIRPLIAFQNIETKPDSLPNVSSMLFAKLPDNILSGFLNEQLPPSKRTALFSFPTSLTSLVSGIPSINNRWPTVTRLKLDSTQIDFGIAPWLPLQPRRLGQAAVDNHSLPFDFRLASAYPIADQESIEQPDRAFAASLRTNALKHGSQSGFFQRLPTMTLPSMAIPAQATNAGLAIQRSAIGEQVASPTKEADQPKVSSSSESSGNSSGGDSSDEMAQKVWSRLRRRLLFEADRRGRY